FTAVFPVSLLARYYSHCVRLNSYSYIAIDPDLRKPVGFVLGGFQTAVSRAAFLREKYIKVGILLLLHPQFIFEKVSSVLVPPQPASSCTCCTLLSIAVAKSYQGTAVGLSLLNHFEMSLRKNQIFRYRLSVRLTNTRAINFYQ